MIDAIYELVGAGRFAQALDVAAFAAEHLAAESSGAAFARTYAAHSGESVSTVAPRFDASTVRP